MLLLFLSRGRAIFLGIVVWIRAFRFSRMLQHRQTFGGPQRESIGRFIDADCCNAGDKRRDDSRRGRTTPNMRERRTDGIFETKSIMDCGLEEDTTRSK